MFWEVCVAKGGESFVKFSKLSSKYTCQARLGGGGGESTVTFKAREEDSNFQKSGICIKYLFRVTVILKKIIITVE